ncbi:putative peptidase family-domain-containing protein [Triangularia setosa]|uniref:Peptidase family-domain-containing protein n=1 Tax=Triangularia setosa TaxID=2587417 RepID=A0AAN6W3L4_9PEZI|nr:putative peptidase family-domain-containing protein [Podospora setosa]
MFTLDNFKTGVVEQVYQRCILITGTTDTTTDHILLKSESRRNKPAELEQQWPVSNGHFKALVLLTPGMNTVSLTSNKNDDDELELRIRYLPLPKTPPLHLAILIAKDSPLSIDCPPTKFGTFSSTHSSLDAAIAKFRVTALMWQALIAEDMRRKGLDRRSFRLDEQWGVDTLTRELVQTSLTKPKDALGWIPQVHLVRTDRTVAQIRHLEGAQLHAVFVEALKGYSGPFVTKAKPVVAGLILDSHFEAKRGLVLGHAAVGQYESHDVSLAMFGSHLTYAWPRFMDEIPDCLLDTRPAGDSVANEQGRCATLWEACAVGQRDFLYQVRRAFGARAEHFMWRDDIIEWPKAFLSHTAYCHQHHTDGKQYDPFEPSWYSPPHDSVWGDLHDFLFFRATRPHFKLPRDKNMPTNPPVIAITGTFEEATITIRSATTIKQVTMQRGPTPYPRFTRSENLWKMVLDNHCITNNAQTACGIKVLADNGVQTEVHNLWAHLHPATTFTIPGHSHMTLEKKSVGPRVRAYGPGWHPWTVMLKKRNPKGKLVRAVKIVLHVGDALDGAIVYYQDGTVATCGRPGPIPGGHQRRSIALKRGADVTCVAVTRWSFERVRWPLIGLRMWMSDGRGMGALNARHAGGYSTEFLTPGEGRKIIGFFGHHGAHGNLCTEFGIVTAPRGVNLPEEVYDAEKWEALEPGEKRAERDEDEETKQEEEGLGHKAKRRKIDDPAVTGKDVMELDCDLESNSDGEGGDDALDDADSGYDDFQYPNQHHLRKYEELYKGKQYKV